MMSWNMMDASARLVPSGVYIVQFRVGKTLYREKFTIVK